MKKFSESKIAILICTLISSTPQAWALSTAAHATADLGFTISLGNFKLANGNTAPARTLVLQSGAAYTQTAGVERNLPPSTSVGPINTSGSGHVATAQVG